MNQRRGENLAFCVLRFALSLAVFLGGAALPVLAQPETFEGNPNSNAFIPIPKDTDDWTRHFRIGALVGLNINADFRMNGAFKISGNDPANGIFDDGYVRHDQTGDPGGYTSYWGYNYDNNNATSGHPSQYNPATGQLSMHALNSFTTSGESASEGGGPTPGIEAEYGGNLWYWKHARVGWDLGLSWLPINITDNQSQAGTVNQGTYFFNVGNPLNIPLPPAPYRGGPSGTGHPIPDTYSSSTNETYDAMVSGSHTLDVSLYAIRFGPSMYWDLTEHLAMSLGAGPAVGVVNGEYRYDETISATSGITAHNRGSIGATDFVWGGYVNATLMYHTSENADIYIGAQFMPMTDATVGSGGRSCDLKLGGQVYLSVGINWAF